MTKKSKTILVGICSVILTIAIAIGYLIVQAGNLSPSASPTSTMYTLEDIYYELDKDAPTTSSWELDSSAGPTSTMYTLQQIYDKIPKFHSNPGNASTSNVCNSVTFYTDSGTKLTGTRTACGGFLGDSCSAPEECGSNNCVDGICCDTACDGTCQMCNIAGSVGTCSNTPVDTDPDVECSSATCTDYISGWSDTSCRLYSTSSSHNGMCNGSGACYTAVTDSCSGVGSQSGSASCGSTGCLKACPAGGTGTDYDTLAEVCYTSAQHSCSTDYACDSSATCEPYYPYYYYAGVHWYDSTHTHCSSNCNVICANHGGCDSSAPRGYSGCPVCGHFTPNGTCHETYHGAGMSESSCPYFTDYDNFGGHYRPCIWVPDSTVMCSKTFCHGQHDTSSHQCPCLEAP